MKNEKNFLFRNSKPGNVHDTDAAYELLAAPLIKTIQ